MKDGKPGKSIYRKDYTAYAWDVRQLVLHFDIGRESTTVRAKMEFWLKEGSKAPADIVLNGKDLQLLSLSLNGRPLNKADYAIDGERLTIPSAPAKSVLESEVKIHPAKNSALEGLYVSGEFLLTQCEAEGFRKITWFPDRPDVMTTYRVTLEADRAEFPVLLSNGNRVDAGELPGGRHWVRWDDPFPKPSYLFALVAGDLAMVEDRFTTRSGRPSSCSDTSSRSLPLRTISCRPCGLALWQNSIRARTVVVSAPMSKCRSRYVTFQG